MATQAALLRAYVNSRTAPGVNTDLSKDPDYQAYQKQLQRARIQQQVQQADAAEAASKNQSLLSNVKKYGAASALDAVKSVIVNPSVNTAKTVANEGSLLAGEATGNNQAITNSTQALTNAAKGSYIAPLANLATLEGTNLATQNILNNKNLSPEQKQLLLRTVVNPSYNQNNFDLNDPTKNVIGKGISLGVQSELAGVGALTLGTGPIAQGVRSVAQSGRAAVGADAGVNSLIQDSRAAAAVTQANQASGLGRVANLPERITDESRLLPAQAGQGAQEITDQAHLLGQGAQNPNLAVPTIPADPALLKRLNTVNKAISLAQRQGGITADQARSLVAERRSLVGQIQNPGSIPAEAQPSVPLEQLNHQDISGTITKHTQQAVLNPDIPTPNIAAGLTKTQSILRDSLVKQFPHLEGVLTPLVHEVHNQAALEKYANNLVAADPVAATQVLKGGALQHINPDAQVKVGYALANRAALSGDTPALNDVLGHTANIGTTGGQTLRAMRIDNLLKPEQLMVYAAKKADAAGRPLTDTLVQSLQKQVKVINKMPDGAAKQQALLALKAAAENPSIFKKGVNTGASFAASVRAIMASTDLSGGGRQGAVLAARFPGIGIKAEALGAKAALSPGTYEKETEKLANLTDAKGVPLSQVFDRMKLHVNQGEEQFQNAALVEKVPGVGQILKGSERAYNLTLSYLRANAAKQIIDSVGGVEAVSKNWNSAQFEALGRVIDTLSGRGRGGTPYLGERSLFEKAAPALSSSLFSARLWKSRLDLLNPLFYGQVAKNPVALKLAIRSGMQFATVVGLTMAAATAAGAKVETDLRSSDFGKLKFGKTRIDIMGGLQQNLVLAWREMSGQSKSSSSGNISSLTSGQYGAPTRFDTALTTVENKLSPVVAEVIRQIQGKDISGQPMTTSDRFKNIGGNFVPLSIQDVYSGIKEQGAGSIPLTATGFLGGGVQTYGPPTKDWTQSTSKQITQFQNTVSPSDFKKANDTFNQQYSAWLQSVNKNSRYQKLSLKDQATVRSNKEQELETKIMSQAGFTYKAKSGANLKGF